MITRCDNRHSRRKRHHREERTGERREERKKANKKGGVEGVAVANISIWPEACPTRCKFDQG